MNGIMGRVGRLHPVVWLPVLLLCCVHFEYNISSHAITFGGPTLLMIILCISAAAMIGRIYKTLTQACLARGFTSADFCSKYEVLIPFAVFALLVCGIWEGPLVRGIGSQDVHRWVFQWSDSTLNLPLIFAILAVAALLRCYTLIKLLTKSS
jgi:hypothetical protein